MPEIRSAKWFFVAIALCCVVAFTGGCKSKNEEPLDTDVTGTDPGMEDTTTGEGLPDMDLSRLLFDPNSPSRLRTIYFDYDSSTLRPDTMNLLKENASKIKETPGVVVQIAGHCDERGTQEYNLALGERRALSVRRYLIQLGVSGDRLITISYGEEFPEAMGSSEDAWASNRRVEFNEAQSR